MPARRERAFDFLFSLLNVSLKNFAVRKEKIFFWPRLVLENSFHSGQLKNS